MMKFLSALVISSTLFGCSTSQVQSDPVYPQAEKPVAQELEINHSDFTLKLLSDWNVEQSQREPDLGVSFAFSASKQDPSGYYTLDVITTDWPYDEVLFGTSVGEALQEAHGVKTTEMNNVAVPTYGAATAPGVQMQFVIDSAVVYDLVVAKQHVGFVVGCAFLPNHADQYDSNECPIILRSFKLK